MEAISTSTTSPGFSTLPTVSDARSRGPRSGRLYASIGVGTVTMNTLQAAMSAPDLDAQEFVKVHREEIYQRIQAGLTAPDKNQTP